MVHKHRNVVRSVELCSHSRLLKPRCDRRKINRELFGHLINVVVVWELRVVRIEVRWGQSPLNIRRTQRTKVVAIIASKAINLASNREDVAAKNGLSVGVEHGSVEGRIVVFVLVWTIVPYPLFKIFIRAQIAESCICSGLCRKGEVRGEFDRTKTLVTTDI